MKPPTRVKIFMVLLLCLQSITSYPQSREVPFTQEDKERLIRLETKIEEKFKAIDQRFETVNQRFESLEKSINQRFEDTNRSIESLERSMEGKFNLLIALIVALMGIMGGFVGFILWDTNKATQPLREENKSIIARLEAVERKLEGRVG